MLDNQLDAWYHVNMSSDMTKAKYCKHCDMEHPLTSEYWQRLNGSPRCKIYAKYYKKQNKKRDAEQNKQYRENNKEHIKQYYQENKKRIAEYNKQWYKKNRDRVLERQNQYNKKNRQQKSNYDKRYSKENRDRIAEYERKRYATDINFKLSYNLRRRLYSAVKGNFKSGSAVQDLGCSIEYLKQYLEFKFDNNMNWNNHGEWHIDHIIPLSSFDLTNRDELLKACHYTNLQPLWAYDNLSKGNK